MMKEIRQGLDNISIGPWWECAEQKVFTPNGEVFKITFKTKNKLDSETIEQIKEVFHNHVASIYTLIYQFEHEEN